MTAHRLRDVYGVAAFVGLVAWWTGYNAHQLKRLVREWRVN